MDKIDEINKISKEKIIRPDYGQTSLKAWEPKYDEIIKKLEFINKYWPQVDNKTHSQISNPLNNLLSSFNELSSFDESRFVSQKQQIINQISAHFDEIKQYWPQFFIAALESSGILEYSELKSDFEITKNLIEALKVQAIEDIGNKTTELITIAEEKANKIEGSARKTSQKVSVIEAQTQFYDAASSNLTNIKIWGGITGLLITLIIGWIIWMLQIKLSDVWTWQFIYESIVRIIIIGFVGTLLAFCLRILKSHLHMREHNLHRFRIANSMASFTESANDNNQRDIILSRLVDTVANFGNSGLIGGDDEGNSKITIDNLTGALGALKPGGN